MNVNPGWPLSFPLLSSAFAASPPPGALAWAIVPLHHAGKPSAPAVLSQRTGTNRASPLPR